MTKKINKLKRLLVYYDFAKGFLRLSNYNIRINFNIVSKLFSWKVRCVKNIKSILRKKLKQIVKKLNNNYWIYDENTGRYIKPNGGKNGKT